MIALEVGTLAISFYLGGYWDLGRLGNSSRLPKLTDFSQVLNYPLTSLLLIGGQTGLPWRSSFGKCGETVGLLFLESFAVEVSPHLIALIRPVVESSPGVTAAPSLSRALSVPRRTQN